MDATVWVQGDERTDHTDSGDTVVMPAGDVVRVGRVVDDAVTWRAEVAPDLLPGLPAAGDEPRRVDDAELLRAIEGVVAADEHRGG